MSFFLCSRIGIVVAVVFGLVCICLPIITIVSVAGCIFHGGSRNQRPVTGVVTTAALPPTAAVVTNTSIKKVDYPEVTANPSVSYNATLPPPPSAYAGQPPAPYPAQQTNSYPAQPPYTASYPAQPLYAASYPAHHHMQLLSQFNHQFLTQLTCTGSLSSTTNSFLSSTTTSILPSSGHINFLPS